MNTHDAHCIQVALSAAMEKIAKRDMPSFTSQDRPKKVKEIYRALKREHPTMPAEMKARIAARQGKPGKQKQGPPYKGPVKPWHEKSKTAQERGPGGHIPDTSGPPPHGRGMGPGGGRQDRSGLKGWEGKSTRPGARLGLKGRSRVAAEAMMKDRSKRAGK